MRIFVGLAAPQVGLNIRLMVFNAAGDGVTDEKGLGDMILVNPLVVESSVEKDREEEGCLSFPQVPIMKVHFSKRYLPFVRMERVPHFSLAPCVTMTVF